MLEKIKDPGSAITHFIGMLMAMFAATPLIIKSLHEPDYIHVISLTVFIVSMILLYAASTIYHTLNLSEKTNRISPQVRPQYDLCTDCRKLHTNLPDRFERSGRIFPVRSCLGNRTDRHYRKNLLDHLSEMVFFCALYQHGLGLRTGFHTDCQFALSGSFWMAPGRRYHLHCRRHHLCFESSAVRCKAQKFRLT